MRRPPLPKNVHATARDRAAAAIAAKAATWPDMTLDGPDTTNLSPADAALATAITRCTVQRWLTLRFLLEKHLSKQLARLEPGMQGVLLTGAAQLLFLDRLPAYAVVDEMVHIARRHVRAGAAGMANAVLRKLAKLAGDRDYTPWTPSPNRLPLDKGSLQLTEAVLPEGDPAVLLSCPKPLFKAWLAQRGEDTAWAMAEHATRTPPVLLTVEADWQSSEQAAPHDQLGHALWTGKAGDLPVYLAQHPDRRVQDPSATLAVASTAELDPAPRRILDLCAGRGTKTRQLARLHPDAEVYANDPNPDTLDDLHAAAQAHANVHVFWDTHPTAPTGEFDLILLDVPCSNTGVLARRPEARYRYSTQTVGDLVQLQRSIIDKALSLLAPDGRLLYSTCSVESAENRNQAQRLARSAGLALNRQHQALPAGHGTSWHDGAYHACLSRPDA
ncbi:MAG: transcription antitermination factor NusB [Planctomycetota bacterium]